MPATIVKQVPNLKIFSDGTVRIDNVRASYPKLFVPELQTNDDGTPKLGKDGQPVKKYSLTGIASVATHREAIATLRNFAIDLAKKTLDPNNPKFGFPAQHLFVRDGAGSGKPEQENAWIIRASESTRPTVLNKSGAPLTAEDGVLYPGCYVSILIRPWLQNNEPKKGGKKVNANLLMVMFLKDGEPLSTQAARPDVADVFGDLSEEFGGDGGGDGLGLGEDDLAL